MMMHVPGLACYRLTILLVVTWGLLTTPLLAQQTVSPDTSVVTVVGEIAMVNRYMFRGIRQNSTKIALWPSSELGFKIHSGDGLFTTLRLNLASWNSLHTGDTGSTGPAANAWYESNLATTLRVEFSGGLSVAGSYVAYISPNDMFSTVKEVALKVAADRLRLGNRPVNPYALVAFEIASGAGEGQTDGGLHAGRYLELGISPSISARRAIIALPVRLGLSLGDYYELAGTDHAFGFVSVASVVTIPVVGMARDRGWNLHGGVEYQVLGETTKVFNGGEHSEVIGSVGIGFSY